MVELLRCYGCCCCCSCSCSWYHSRSRSRSMYVWKYTMPSNRNVHRKTMGNTIFSDKPKWLVVHQKPLILNHAHIWSETLASQACQGLPSGGTCAGLALCPHDELVKVIKRYKTNYSVGVTHQCMGFTKQLIPGGAKACRWCLCSNLHLVGDFPAEGSRFFAQTL